MIPMQTIQDRVRTDEGAELFGQWVQDYSGMLYRICLRLLADPAEAEDAVQDTLLRAWQARDRYDSRYRPATWLRTIACRRCYDRLRQLQRQDRLEDVAAEAGPAGGPADSVWETREQLALLRRLTRELPPVQRTVFVLSELEGEDADRISRLTGFGKGRIKASLYLARRNIRKQMELWNRETMHR